MIETKRLTIKPLSHNELLLYIKNDGSLEKELKIQRGRHIISAELLEALQESILTSVANAGDNYLYYTLWTAILKSENKMVGDCCFKGKPDEEGKVEIGYGTYDQYQGKGIMTEIVNGMIEWAKTQKNIMKITAETDKANIASGKVLQKNGFVISHQSDTLFYWYLNIKKNS